MAIRRLAFDCSGDLRSAALSCDETVLVEREETGARAHAERLVPLIGCTLKTVGWHWTDIDEIAVAAGPGSFTGIRVAVAAARALALGLDKPVRPVTTLDALLAGAPEANLAAIDARRGGVYAAVRRRDGSARSLGAVSPAAAATAGPSPLIVVGSGADLVVEAAGAGRPLSTPVRANVVARAAAAAASAGVVAVAGTDVRPLYVRRADATPQAA